MRHLRNYEEHRMAERLERQREAKLLRGKQKLPAARPTTAVKPHEPAPPEPTETFCLHGRGVHVIRPRS
jgi:hypothetical protein